ncbi:hypothetical protein DAERI_020234 [Deinococcus aerius]|uniref:DUF1345 domain-containing protein n=2 Tax=Deinococcus TaxID=1298 RepID=A0A2I9DQU1_9DEIO|nr:MULTISPECIES: DUF1345 domain-containing protein [Deinococcus]MBB5293903.1 putative membrane protein [Deinococcus metallilatus]QBY07153.1 DUF1345 domain-containing protein [Deinococcus metallilatus]RXJ14625.1 DUF1345 domain-containing protein [Deinococcus metallilatus]TLK30745.1 DUF1345 domain-containing protein [Deinococcus metallilatus]GBF04637.1 hypothetical protein DAERI_020234 [Deinococcus aerius]
MTGHSSLPQPHAGWQPSWSRLLLAGAAGLAAALVLPAPSSALVRIMVGWDGAALTLLALTWGFILRSPPGRTRHAAAAEDPGRAAVQAVVLGSSLVSLVASAVVIEHAKRLEPEAPLLAIAVAVVAVLSGWFLTHTTYTLRYAHLYYSDGDEEAGPDGGLEFPGASAPSALDFAYFAFVLGMTFQVSDVAVSSPVIRRLALWHGITAFWFNVAILALTLNVLGSQI